MSADLLPSNGTKAERSLSQATARMGTVPNDLGKVWNPQTCPLPVLAYLAWALSVDEWDANWSETQKRAAVASSVEVHRRKGTFGAVRRAVNALGYEVSINENTGEPYTFRLAVNVSSGQPVPPEAFTAIESAALRTKNARSYLAGIDTYLQSDGPLTLVALMLSGTAVSLWPASVRELVAKGMSLLSACHFAFTATIFPEMEDTITLSGPLLSAGAVYTSSETIYL